MQSSWSYSKIEKSFAALQKNILTAVPVGCVITILAHTKFAVSLGPFI